MTLITQDNIRYVKEGDFVKVILKKSYNYERVYGKVIVSVNGPCIVTFKDIPSRTLPELKTNDLIHLNSICIEEAHKFTCKEKVLYELGCSYK